MKTQQLPTERSARRMAALVFGVVAAILAGAGYWGYCAEAEVALRASSQTHARDGMVHFAPIAGLFILVSAALVALYYRGRQTRIMANLITAEKRRTEAMDEAREIGERHSAILQAIVDGFWLVDTDGRIQEVNAAYCRMSGYSATELKSMRIADLEALENREEISSVIQKIITQGADRFESRHRRKDGSIFDVEVSVQSRPTGGVIAAFVRDITVRKRAQARVVRLSMLYAALSECNDAIVHAGSAAELMPRICRNVVEQGGLKMAWIATPDAASGRVFPSAAYGDGLDYLSDIEISVNADEAMGRGPTGTTIREGIPVWCNDFQNAAGTAPWHASAGRFGWKSSGTIPLRLRKKTIGALTVYSDTCDAFDEEIRALLVKMADNISFALDHFAEEDERRREHLELISLRTAVEQSASTIVITDPEGNIEYVNPAFEKSSGYSMAEAIGRNPRVLSSGEQSIAFYQQLWASIKSGHIWRGEFHNRRKDGSLYWEKGIISPVVNDSREVVHFIAIKDDITKRKVMEAKLLEALDRAEAGNRAKRDFLSMMSHELRTPLNGIIGFADLLADTQTDAEHRSWAQMISSSGYQLLKLVSDILDFSNIDNSNTTLEAVPIGVADLVETSCKKIHRNAAERGLAFHIETAPGVPEQIHGDRRRISQILVNLLANAVKFTSHGSVVLRLAAVVDGGRHWLEFTIEDTGVGISTEKLGILFQPFTQADSTLRRPFEGAGLGLAISQQLAEAMGGSISVTSTQDLGSTFTFRLPVDAGGEIGAPPTGGSGG
ncbi:MAG: PAS domain S-box protein [Verrucomicrobiota bacterium]